MPRFDRWRRMTLLAMTCSIACFLGCGDPVDYLGKAVRDLLDPYALDEAIDTVNRSERGNDAAALLIGLLNDNNSSVRSRAARSWESTRGCNTRHPGSDRGEEGQRGLLLTTALSRL
jgi:hypothetical protein